MPAFGMIAGRAIAAPRPWPLSIAPGFMAAPGTIDADVRPRVTGSGAMVAGETSVAVVVDVPIWASGELIAASPGFHAYAETYPGISVVGQLKAGNAVVDAEARVAVEAVAVMVSGHGTVDAEAGPVISTSGELAASPGELLAAAVMVIAAHGELGAAPGTLAAEVAAVIGAGGDLYAGAAAIDVATRFTIAVDGDLVARGALLAGSANTSDQLVISGDLKSGPAHVEAEVSTLVGAAAELRAQGVEISASVLMQMIIAAAIEAGPAGMEAVTSVRIVAQGTTAAGSPTITAEIDTDSRAVRTVTVVFY